MGSVQVTRRRVAGAVAAVVVSAITLVEVAQLDIVSSGPPPASGSANLWIDADGGSCARQATAGAYSDAAACSSSQAAYTAAACGDTVRYRAGTSYGSLSISSGTKSCTTASYIVFRPEDDTPNAYGTASSVRVSGISLTKANCWCDIRDFDTYNDAAGTAIGQTAGSVSFDAGSGSAPQNAQIVVRRVDSRRGFIRMNDVSIIGGSFGGMDACADGDGGDQDAVNITSGSSVRSQRILIEGARFHDMVGTASCADHSDFLQALAGSFITIRGNRFSDGPDEDLIMRPYLDILSDITVENNMFGVENGAGSQSIIVGAQTDSCSNITVQNNSGAESMNGVCNGTNNVWRNNVATACAITGYTSSNNVAINSSCGTGSKNCTPTFVNANWQSSGDLHIASGDTCARNSGHASLFASLDFDGQTRPQGSSDIGADEIP